MSADPIISNASSEQETLSAWLRGWRAELRAAWRQAWAPFAEESARGVCVAYGASEIDVLLLAGHDETLIATIASDRDDTRRLLASALAEACAKANASDVTIRLPAGEALRTRVRLPYTTRRSIGPMLGYELERLSPLPLEELYFDFRIAERERSAGRTDVDLRIVKREIVDRALAAVHDAGRAVSAIEFADDDAPVAWRQFPLDRLAILRSHWRRFGVAWLAGLCLLLAAAITVAAYVRGMETRSAVEDQLEAGQSDALQVENLKHRLDDARAQITFVSAKKAEQPSLLVALSALTDVLPDGSWLTEMSLQGRKIHVQGYAHSASDLIALIDRSPHFADAQFDAPVVQSSNRLDRFDITFDIKAGAP